MSLQSFNQASFTILIKKTIFYKLVKMWNLLQLCTCSALVILVVVQKTDSQQEPTKCYDDLGKPQVLFLHGIFLFRMK